MGETMDRHADDKMTSLRGAHYGHDPESLVPGNWKVPWGPRTAQVTGLVGHLTA